MNLCETKKLHRENGDTQSEFIKPINLCESQK